MQLSELTIIVPTRNERHNIPAFLSSLPAAVDLIVVDASQDETPELITALRPAHTLVIRHPGRIAPARQLGAEAARTPWLLFTDADVVFAPDYFTRLIAYGDDDAFYGPKLSTDDFAHYYAWFARGQALAHHLGIPAISGSNMLIKRQALMAVGGFDLRLTCNEDTEVGWRLKRRGYKVGFAPLMVYERDHRRLQAGALRKTLHSLSRCLLLYFHLLPARWLSHDWGYWSRSVSPTTASTHPSPQ